MSRSSYTVTNAAIARIAKKVALSKDRSDARSLIQAVKDENPACFDSYLRALIQECWMDVRTTTSKETAEQRLILNVALPHILYQWQDERQNTRRLTRALSPYLPDDEE